METDTQPNSGTYFMLDPVARRVSGRPVYARVRGDSDRDGEPSDDFLYYWEFDNGHNWIIRCVNEHLGNLFRRGTAGDDDN